MSNPILPSFSGNATKRVKSQPEVTHMKKPVSITKKPRKQQTPEFRHQMNRTGFPGD